MAISRLGRGVAGCRNGVDLTKAETRALSDTGVNIVTTSGATSSEGAGAGVVLAREAVVLAAVLGNGTTVPEDNFVIKKFSSWM